MYTLGISDSPHDASICIMRDNYILGVIEEERISRIKHATFFPEEIYTIEKHAKGYQEIIAPFSVSYREDKYIKLTEYCLKPLGLSFKDINHIVISSLFDEIPFSDKAIVIDHHYAHAASAFYPSPFERSGILIVDGNGNTNPENNEINTSLMAVGEHSAILPLKQISGMPKISNSLLTLSNSLGFFYMNITVLMGLKSFGEGKTMALASYGKSLKYYKEIKQYINMHDNGVYHIDNASIFQYCETMLEQARRIYSDEILFQMYADMALGHQKILEDIIQYCANHIYQETKLETLCLAGGVMLNCVANRKILENTPISNIFIQPAAGDDGVSIGCAMHGYYQNSSKVKKSMNKKHRFSPYLGRKFNDNQINKAIESHTDKLSESQTIIDLLDYVAELIYEGNVIGWYQGRSEIGPRALGNRSILADPRPQSIKDKINRYIKKREPFRPFAPAVLSEKVNEYFEMEQESPYMTMTASIRELYKDTLCAITHYDGTARVQTVHHDLNPRFYDLIQAYEKLSGIPILLNTSFNGPAEPIVDSPEDAILCAKKIGLDYLVLEGRIFKVNKQQQINVKLEYRQNIWFHYEAS